MLVICCYRETEMTWKCFIWFSASAWFLSMKHSDWIMFHLSGPGDIRVVAEEGSDVILPCSHDTMENIVTGLFDWKKDGQKEVFLYDAGLHYNNGRPGQDPQFKGRVSHFPDQLQHGNASIKINNTKMADSGNYTCIFPLLKPNRKTFHIELLVGECFH